MNDLPLKFLIKLAKIPMYVGMTFLLINVTLVFFTAIRVNTIAHTAMLVINENNFMPAYERDIIVQELANMGRPVTVDRQNLTNPIGIEPSPNTNIGSPIVGGWTETWESLRLIEERVQHGVVSEFEMFVWFRPYIPVFGNLAVRGYAPVASANDGFTDFNTAMLNEYGVVGGQTAGAGFAVTDNNQSIFGDDRGWNWQGNHAADGGPEAGGLQAHLDAERSWFDFRIGGCFRAVGLSYYPDLLFDESSRGGCPSYGM